MEENKIYETQANTPRSNKTAFIAIAGIVALGALWVGFQYAKKNENQIMAVESQVMTQTEATKETTTPVTTSTIPVSAPKKTETPTEALTKMYKDGTYTVDGKYNSPAGPETIGISLVIKDDVIVDATAVAHATNPKSKMMQEMFVAGFKAQVVGKKLSEVVLTKVSGSSLTPKGFNDAVTQIRIQASV